MRAITKDSILTTATATYEGTPFYHHSTIGQYDAHMTTYAQRATFYNLYLYLGYNMYYILFHIHAVWFTLKTSYNTVLFVST